ncbi:MAG: GAP family protein [Methanobacterium sp.]
MPELTSLVVSILPYAIGAAVGPTIFATLLATVIPNRNPRLSASAYLLGSIIMFLILVFFGLYIGTALSVSILGPINIGAMLEIFLGSILIIIALRYLFISEQYKSEGILGFINNLREENNLSLILKFFYIGFIALFASFIPAILILGAGMIIGLSNPGSTYTAITVIELALIGLLVVEVPFILFLISPRLAIDVLNPFSDWLTRYGEYFAAIIYFLIGLIFIIRGAYAF